MNKFREFIDDFFEGGLVILILFFLMIAVLIVIGFCPDDPNGTNNSYPMIVPVFMFY